MYILGVNAYHGDSSACIFKNGNLIAASEEERFRRIKHWAGFPSKAIQFCLDEAKIDIKDLDYIAISRDPKANFKQKVFTALKNRLSIKNIIDRLKNLKKASSIEKDFAEHFNITSEDLAGKIINVEHHRSHLASAFFASPYQESALLSIDGFGDFSSTMTGVGKDLNIDVLNTVSYPHSLGLFYTLFTQYLGFPHYGDEYKIMGLAPYGNAIYKEQVLKVIKLKDDGFFELNLDYFNHPKKGVQMVWENGIPAMEALFTQKLIDDFGPLRNSEEALTQYHKDLAASVQKVTEETIIHMLNHLHKETGLESICIAGGVAQNSVANGKILSATPFKSVYIPPAGHDAGTAIGAALWQYNQILKQPRIKPMLHGFFGSQFDQAYIEQLLRSKNIAYKKTDWDDLNDQISDCLVKGEVVGWFQGRAEFGPRALGHRSILADPRRADAKEILNSKIKRRESFRPFAPSILKEYVKDFFEQDDDVPFMEKVYTIKTTKRKEIPAVCHVDGTGRLQTVEQATNPRYYDLIKAFYSKTGIPILLNTSFNENEPIVNTPEEALNCFLRTKMDVLVLENFIITR